MPDLKLRPDQLSTITLALCGWSARCGHEADAMRELAGDYPEGSELRRKCVANAEASKRFKSEADELLHELREQRFPKAG